MTSAALETESNHPSPWTPALAGGVLLWAGFPPLGLWPLAWIGLFVWLRLIADPKSFERPKSFRAVWLSSFIFWLASDYYVTMPHWAGFFGWIAMSAYLSIYFPFFFASSRAMVHRYGIPLILAATISWVAMEWLRAHVITGYGMAMLPHTMYQYPLLIQTADIMGGYGTSFLIVLISASLVVAVPIPAPARGDAASTIPAQQRTEQGSRQLANPSRRRMAHALIGLATLAFALAYGAWRLSYPAPSTKPPIPVALIQGSRDVRFELTREDAEREMLIAFREYRDLTVQARQRWPDLKLVIWPESAFPQADAILQSDEHLLPGDKRSALIDLRESVNYCCKVGIGIAPLRGDLTDLPQLREAIPLLTGGQSFDAVREDNFNSALMFDRAGQICFRYHKMHLVMFGEYIPLGELFPFVYNFTPIPGGLAAGREPKVFEVEGLQFSPSICFESTVGHLIRRHVRQLKSAGREPDALVNLTNDGWFYGTNCLDLHLACNVFRAVELRKPVLVAANTGFSAHIDGSGRLLQLGPRRKTAILRADVVPDLRTSPYLLLGDWPAIIMTLLATAALISHQFRRMRNLTTS